MKLTAALFCLLTFSASAKSDWSRFRGPNGQGYAETSGLPEKIDESTTLWKIPVGTGWSSPVLWEKQVIYTEEHGSGTRAVVCLDAETGKEVWRHELPFNPHNKHKFNTFASSTPFVDAERIYINWTTGNDVEALALDHQGKEIWRNPKVANYIHEHGSGVSSIVADGVMIVRSEFETQKEGKSLATDEQKDWKSSVVGLDAATGKQRWKVELPNTVNPFSTPLVHDTKGGKHEFIFANTTSGFMGLDCATGKINWQHNPGYKQRSLGSFAFADQLLFGTMGSGAGGKESAVLDLSSGKPKEVYSLTKSIPYVPSPLVVKGNLYLLGDGGILKCVDFKTGQEHFEERLSGEKGSTKYFSSPVAGDGKLYCCSQTGEVITVKLGDKFEQLAVSKLDSPMNASPAIGDGRIFVRTEKMLWCAGAKKPPLP